MALPNFFLVGAPKAGTTSLYLYLGQHPDVFVCPIKEPCFFAPEVADLGPHDRLVLDWDEYLRLFEGVRSEQAIGEASVAYLASLTAASAIRSRIPDARIVMMLRNPIDRLFSRYLAARDKGDAATFTAWLDRRVAEDEGRSTPGGPIWPGRYAVHLQRYLATFPPRHVRAFLYDDYMHSPTGVVAGVLEFLGVDPTYPVDVTRRHNVTMTRRWPKVHARLAPLRPFVPARVAAIARRWTLTPRLTKPTARERAHAIEVYRDDIRALETLIQRDLSKWRDELGDTGSSP